MDGDFKAVARRWLARRVAAGDEKEGRDRAEAVQQAADSEAGCEAGCDTTCTGGAARGRASTRAAIRERPGFGEAVRGRERE